MPRRISIELSDDDRIPEDDLLIIFEESLITDEDAPDLERKIPRDSQGRCLLCGSTAGDEYYCPDCGAEVI